MKNTIQLLLALISVGVIAQTNTENFIKTISYTEAFNLSELSTVNEDFKIEQVGYSDGLGRMKQSLSLREGGDFQTIIQYHEYDEFGREVKQFLPYSATLSNDDYRSSSIISSELMSFYDTGKYGYTTNPYSETRFEKSPQQRPLEQGAPGNEWAIGEHSVKTEYGFNKPNDILKFWVILQTHNSAPELSYSGDYFESKSLRETLIKDENYNALQGVGSKGVQISYSDKQGRVVLDRRANISYQGQQKIFTDVHDTYYIYDDYGNLTYVLSPELSSKIVSNGELVSNWQALLDDLGYQFRYDNRNRLIEKKIPGKGKEKIVYDALDRPILTQDAIQQQNNEWLFTKYDAFGRVAYTGVYSSGFSQSEEQARANTESLVVSELQKTALETPTNIGGTQVYYSNDAYPMLSLEVLTVNYYDTYVDHLGVDLPTDVYGVVPSSTNTKGLPTVSKVKVLDVTPSNWITTITGYDAKARAVYVESRNTYLGTSDKVYSKLDFVGKVLETTTTHEKSGHAMITTTDAFTYDHMGRMLTHLQYLDDSPVQLITSNTYDELGQLVSKKVGGEIFESGYSGIENISVTPQGVITKDTGTNSYDGGLSTLGVLQGDGGIRFRAVTEDKRFAVGLNNISSNESHSEIDYSFVFFWTSNKYKIRIKEPGHSSAYLTGFVNYQAGDDFSIEREGNVLSFMHNGDEVASHTMTTNYVNLVGDISMADIGCSITDLDLYATQITKYLQKVDYTYNVRGWLTNINDVSTLFSSSIPDLFHFKINYNEVVANSSATPLYNGNISQTIWRSENDDDDLRLYSYSYDYLNRIVGAKGYKGSLLSNIVPDNFHNLEDVGYDMNGNILTLKRHGLGDHSGMWDDLSYSYYPNTNQLQAVADVAPAVSKQGGFKDGATLATEYTYDVNGNMLTDSNKEITQIEYNHLNLPTRIEVTNQVSTDEITYVYDATGIKLSKKVTTAMGDVYTYYAGNYVYSEGVAGSAAETLQFMNHPEGYIEPVANTNKSTKGFDANTGETTYSSYNYVFQYKDHLGNVRLSYSDSDNSGDVDDSEIIEESNYYPFGLIQKGYNYDIVGGNSLAQKFKYNGIEFEESLGLNLYEMDLRSYDPAIGRFNGLDPVIHYSQGTSVAFDNNPIFWADPSGADAFNSAAASGHFGFSEIGGSSMRLDIIGANGSTHVSIDSSTQDIQEAIDRVGGDMINLSSSMPSHSTLGDNKTFTNSFSGLLNISDDNGYDINGNKISDKGGDEIDYLYDACGNEIGSTKVNFKMLGGPFGNIKKSDNELFDLEGYGVRGWTMAKGTIKQDNTFFEMFVGGKTAGFVYNSIKVPFFKALGEGISKYVPSLGRGKYFRIGKSTSHGREVFRVTYGNRRDHLFDVDLGKIPKKKL